MTFINLATEESLILFGGSAADALDPEIFSYDPLLNKWTTIIPSQDINGRTYHCAVYDSEDRRMVETITIAFFFQLTAIFQNNRSYLAAMFIRHRKHLQTKSLILHFFPLLLLLAFKPISRNFMKRDF